MKRDMDLVRLILLFVEQQDAGAVDKIVIDGYSPNVVYEHVKLLEEHNLISNCMFDIMGNVSVESLTWEGYDFLDKIRDDSRWHNIKSKIKATGLPLMVDTINTVASAIITATAEGVANSIIKNGGV